MFHFRRWSICISAFLLAVSVNAAESICLKTGFCLEANSHRLADGVLLIESGSGSLEVPADQVEQISLLPSADITPAKTSSNTIETAVDSETKVRLAAVQAGLEPDFVRSVAAVESGLSEKALSRKGAIGLMQLTPATAAFLHVNPNVANENALGGATFLRQLLLRYKGNSALALAAYNAGPGAVEKYKGVPPYMETHRYIIRVLQEYQRRQHHDGVK